VEAVVAVAVVILLVTGLVSATTSALRSNQMSKTRTQALQYAKEGLEIVRIVKDTTWSDIPEGSQTFCLSKNQQTLGSPVSGDCPMDIDNMFSRSLSFSQDATCTDPTCRIVISTVSWMENEKRSVTLTSFITNWRAR
jgi:hypothetical protein